MEMWTRGSSSQNEEDVIVGILCDEVSRPVTTVDLNLAVDELKLEFQIMRGNLNEMKLDLYIELQKQFILLFQRMTIATIVICAAAIGSLSMIINIAMKN